MIQKTNSKEIKHLFYEYLLDKVGENNIIQENNEILLFGKKIIFEDNAKYIFEYSSTISSINLIKDNTQEFLIRDIDGHYYNDLDFSDEHLSIKISEASNDMCLFLLFNKFDFVKYPIIRHRLERIETDENNSINVFDVLKSLCRGIYSIKIDNIIQEEDFDKETIAKSCIFNLSMQKCYNFALVQKTDNLREYNKIHHRHLLIGPVNVPHLKYNDDMVEYYLQGNAVMAPKIQFLSFYNVLEYQFDKLFYDEKYKEIQSVIINPKFDYKNLKSYKKIVELFNNKNTFSEKDMLRNLFNVYLDLNLFRKFLAKNDYYTLNSAHKIKDTKLSLSDNDNDLKSKLLKRVYGLRNAIVHSKDSIEDKYMPADEKYIIPEIDLIKFLAEQVIIKSATII